MTNLWNDIRYGVRMLLRTPTLSAVSILTIGLGYFLSQPLRFVMFGVETTDAGVYLSIVLTLVATGLIATLFPAHRAVRVDPVTALRPD